MLEKEAKIIDIEPFLQKRNNCQKPDGEPKYPTKFYFPDWSAPKKIIPISDICVDILREEGADHAYIKRAIVNEGNLHTIHAGVLRVSYTVQSGAITSARLETLEKKPYIDVDLKPEQSSLDICFATLGGRESVVRITNQPQPSPKLPPSA